MIAENPWLKRAAPILFAKGEAALNFSNAFEANEFPSTWNLVYPRIAGKLKRDVF